MKDYLLQQIAIIVLLAGIIAWALIILVVLYLIGMMSSSNWISLGEVIIKK